MLNNRPMEMFSELNNPVSGEFTMVNREWDLILVGGGLANGLIAWHLRQRRPELRVLLLEAGEKAGGNHTWSFHQADLTPEQHAWIAPLVSYRWPGYEVRFPAFTRTLSGGYLSIISEHFADALANTLGESLLTSAEVATLSPQTVTLVNGRILTAGAVIDGRGYRPDARLTTGAQAFLGQLWRLRQPHGLTQPILMDATVDQQQGYRFVYTLPFSPTELLIEDTSYVDRATFDNDRARRQIRVYAGEQGWQLESLLREEEGILPIMLAGEHRAFWAAQRRQPCSGLRAGLFHATTGYSLPLAVRLAEAIAGQPDLRAAALFPLIHGFARQQWREQRFFRLLNRMLFLAGQPENRWRVMQRFYALNDGLIARFYAGQPTLADRVRILTGKPPVPPGEAILAALKQTSRLRAFKHG